MSACGGGGGTDTSTLLDLSTGRVGTGLPDNRVFYKDEVTGSLRAFDGNRPAESASAPVMSQLSGRVGGIALDPFGNRFWVTETHENRVVLLDATTMAPLKELATGGAPGAVVIDAANGRAYIANADEATVSVFDTEPPYEELEGSPVTVGAEPVDIALTGGFRIVVANAGDASLTVFDAEPPFANASTTPLDGAPSDLEPDEADGLVFVACREVGSLWVYDRNANTLTRFATDLGGPVQMSRLAKRDLLFVAMRDADEVRVYSSAATPAETATIELAGGAAGVAANSLLDTVFVSGVAPQAMRGFEGEAPFAEVEDITGGVPTSGPPARAFPFEPQRLQVLKAPEGGTAEGVRALNGRLYIAHGTAGMVVLDDTDSRATYDERLLGRVQVIGAAEDVEVKDGHAFISNQWQGVQIVELTETEKPGIEPGEVEIEVEGVIVRTVNGLGFCDELRLDGPFLHVDVDTGGLQVLEVSTPDEAARVNGIGAGGPGFDFRRSTKTAFFALSGPTVRGIELRTPQGPLTSTPGDVPVAARDVATLDERFVAVASDVGGLWFVRTNLTGLEVTTPLANIALESSAQRVEVEGHTVFATDSGSRVHIVDARSAENPRLLGLLASAAPNTIQRDGHRLLICAGGTGLDIWRFFP
ncbi:MAG: hypothetical protein ACYTGN_07415 [Planctomycetota bacterium]